MIGRFLRKRALEQNRSVRLWRKFGRPSLEDWSEYLRRYGNFHHFGANCAINPSCYFANPELTFIGNNVRIAGAFLTGHDGSINMINHAIGTKFDAVGPIIIHDDVFIGYGAILLPGVSVGPRAVIGAGSVVARDVPQNSVVAGNPARHICTFDEYVEKLETRNKAFPWRPLIEQRDGGFDPVMEPKLKEMRVRHYFG